MCWCKIIGVFIDCTRPSLKFLTLHMLNEPCCAISNLCVFVTDLDNVCLCMHASWFHPLKFIKSLLKVYRNVRWPVQIQIGPLMCTLIWTYTGQKCHMAGVPAAMLKWTHPSYHLAESIIFSRNILKKKDFLTGEQYCIPCSNFSCRGSLTRVNSPWKAIVSGFSMTGVTITLLLYWAFLKYFIFWYLVRQTKNLKPLAYLTVLFFFLRNHGLEMPTMLRR